MTKKKLKKPKKKKLSQSVVKKKKSPKKKQKKISIIKVYLLWKSMPFIFREIAIRNPKKLNDWGIDTNEEIFLKLMACRYKKDFAKEFKVSRRTLDRWDKDEEFQKKLDEINKRSNVLRFKKDIDFHFTQKTITESDAKRVRLWYELFMGWVPEEKVRHAGKISLLEVLKEAHGRD